MKYYTDYHINEIYCWCMKIVLINDVSGVNFGFKYFAFFGAVSPVVHHGVPKALFKMLMRTVQLDLSAVSVWAKEKR